MRSTNLGTGLVYARVECHPSGETAGRSSKGRLAHRRRRYWSNASGGLATLGTPVPQWARRNTRPKIDPASAISRGSGSAIDLERLVRVGPRLDDFRGRRLIVGRPGSPRAPHDTVEVTVLGFPALFWEAVVLWCGKGRAIESGRSRSGQPL